jgi:hypothetical protein
MCYSVGFFCLCNASIITSRGAQVECEQCKHYVDTKDISMVRINERATIRLELIKTLKSLFSAILDFLNVQNFKPSLLTVSFYTTILNSDSLAIIII